MNLPTFEDLRGSLTVIEDCPFLIRRVFWIYNVPAGQARAGHSHDLCQQALVCQQGSVIVKTDEQTTVLNEPDRMLVIPTGIMITLHNFSQDAILLVLASEKYDPKDNIPNS